MQSKPVYQMILCFLLAGRLSLCPNLGAAILVSPDGLNTYSAQSEGSRAASAEDTGVIYGYPRVDCLGIIHWEDSGHPHQVPTPHKGFNASDRIEVVPPNQPVALAEEVEIPLRIHTRGLTCLDSQQHERRFGSWSNEESQIRYHSDGSAYVTIVPLRLGQVELHLVGMYPDYGIVLKQITLDVQPTRPAWLTVGSIMPTTERGITPTTVVLALAPKPGEYGSYAPLAVFAKYDGVPEWIEINPPFVTFRIINWDGKAPPIHLDSERQWITPLSLGQALLETTYGGRRVLTCVDVEEKLTPGRSYFEKNCKQLLAPGEKFGMQE